MKLKKRTQTPAYMKGFRDGLMEGVEENTFKSEWNRHLYRAGFGAGVRALKEIENPEEYKD